jgi:hypothetical protein
MYLMQARCFYIYKCLTLSLPCQSNWLTRSKDATILKDGAWRFLVVIFVRVQRKWAEYGVRNIITFPDTKSTCFCQKNKVLIFEKLYHLSEFVLQLPMSELLSWRQATKFAFAP